MYKPRFPSDVTELLLARVLPGARTLVSANPQGSSDCLFRLVRPISHGWLCEGTRQKQFLKSGSLSLIACYVIILAVHMISKMGTVGHYT